MARYTGFLAGVVAFVCATAAPARADFTAMTHQGCITMSIVDANTGFLLKARSIGGFKLHKLSSGAWDAGTNVTIGSFLLVNEIADMHFVDVNTGWVVGSSDTIYKTVDGGATWTGTKITASGGQNKFLVQHIDFGSKTHGVVTGRYGAVVATQPLVAVTTDGGATWKDVTLPSDCQGVTSAAMAGLSTLVIGGLRAAAAAAIWVSNDGGQSWTKRNIIAKGVTDVQFIDDKVGFVVSYPPAGVAVPNNEQVIVTTDGGQTWTSPSGVPIPVQILSTAWVDKDNGYVAGVGAGNNGLGIARTTDGGKTWNLEATPADPIFQKPNLQIHTMEYPGPAAYACLSDGAAPVLKNETAGGARPNRYGGGTPTPDAGPLADSGPSVDASPSTDGAMTKDSGPSADGAPKSDGGGSSGGGDSGGCAVAGEPVGLGALLFALGFVALRRRRRGV